MNAVQILADTASMLPWKTFVIFEDERISYGDFYNQTLRVANGLRRMGIKCGDRVLIFGTNSIDWILAEMGIFAAGGILVTLNPQYKFREIEYIVKHSEAETIFVDSGLEESFAKMRRGLPGIRNLIYLRSRRMDGVKTIGQMIEENEPLWGPIHREGNDLARITYTSGTTGKPKGVCQRHEGYHWLAGTFCRAWFKSDDIVLIMMPLAFGYASTIELLPSIRIGASCVVLERFHPKAALEAIRRYKITLVEGVPTMYRMMLNCEGSDSYDLSSLRFVVSAGAILPWELATRFKERFGVHIIDYYGLTEASPVLSYDMTVAKESRPNSCGVPFFGAEARIVDDRDCEVPIGVVGEVAVRCPSMMRGYYKDKEATDRTISGGWVHTGDMGRKDREGYFYVVDRKKDMIIRGGANIYPAEIEEVLYSSGNIAEAAVVGVADEVFGQQVRAVVVAKEGSEIHKEEILDLCEKNLADYKVPKYLEIWDEIPKGPTGKILKTVIREIPLGKSYQGRIE